MNPSLEIIIPAWNADASLTETVTSLLAQTNRQFSVLIANQFEDGKAHLEAAQDRLTSAGVLTRCVTAAETMSPIEFWNWTFAQSSAAWLKPLFSGEQLKPAFIDRLLQRIRERPQAQVIRCDLELRTEWGTELLTPPFESPSITASEFTNYFPAQVDWLLHSANFTFSRAAWLALGGFSPFTQSSTILNLNVMLALNHGIENILEPLASIEWPAKPISDGRFCRVSELWLILLQARNYCLAAKLPWTSRCLLLRSLIMSLRSR